MKAKQKTNKDTLKKLFGYIKKRTVFVVMSAVFAAANVVLSLLIPVYTGDVVDLCIKSGTDLKEIVLILIKIIICVLAAAVSQWLLTAFNNRTAYYVCFDIRNDAFKKLNRLPVSFFDSHPHGDILSRLTNDIEQISDGLILGFTNLFSGILTILITLVFMFRLNPLTALVVVLVTPLSLFVSAFIAKHSFRMFKFKSTTNGEQTSFINETIEFEKAVNAYDMREEKQAEFDDINFRLSEYSLKATFYSSLTNPCTRFVNSLVYAGVGVFGAMSAINGGITIGQLSAFLSYASKYTKPFNEISGVITEFQNAFACAGRVFDFMENEELTDCAGNFAKNGELQECSENFPENKNKEIKAASPIISIKNISFSYTPEKPLISDFSLDVTKGQKIAIVGPTGCGKTTLINLLMRFYDVNSGEIELNGVNIKELSREALRQNIAMVLQDTWIRRGTVKENIALGKKDATDAEVTEAAKKAHAWSFIKRLPDGIDTMLSENGDELSQGQKQLISIARVMLVTPPILILDEATSSIDTRTEIKIQQAFDEMMKGRTSFIVAHRLSTIVSADKILVMNNGNVVETGTHAELLQKNGFYAELYNSRY